MMDLADRQKRWRQLTGYAIMFGISLAFYMIFYLLDGIVMTEDAPSYINMQSDREPGYCLYLWLFREIFGNGIYLHAAVIMQCIIAAAATCAIVIKLAGLFSLNWLGSAGIFMIQCGITLLNRFVAQRRCSYFNSIETEGLAYSLWVFYFLCILGIWYKGDRKSLFGAVGWSVVLISIRKHMMITLVILFLTILFSYMKRHQWKKAIFYALFACVLGLTATKLIDCSYNFMMRGEFASHTGDSSFILGTELYLADKDMVQEIQDTRNKEIFMEIMNRADEKEYNIAYAGRGWQAIEDHYSNAYDRIKFDIVMVVIREYQEAQGIAEADREADYNLIAGTLMKELLIPSVPNLFRLFWCNVIHGLITTILKTHSILNWVALLLYLLYSVSIGVLSRLRRRCTDIIPNSAEYFALFVLLAIIVNVCFTSLTIYCQMRYMLYNTGLFYQAWWIMLLQINKCRKDQRSNCI